MIFQNAVMLVRSLPMKRRKGLIHKRNTFLPHMPISSMMSHTTPHTKWQRSQPCFRLLTNQTMNRLKTCCCEPSPSAPHPFIYLFNSSPIQRAHDASSLGASFTHSGTTPKHQNSPTHFAAGYLFFLSLSPSSFFSNSLLDMSAPRVTRGAALAPTEARRVT